MFLRVFGVKIGFRLMFSSVYALKPRFCLVNLLFFVIKPLFFLLNLLVFVTKWRFAYCFLKYLSSIGHCDTKMLQTTHFKLLFLVVSCRPASCVEATANDNGVTHSPGWRLSRAKPPQNSQGGWEGGRGATP